VRENVVEPENVTFKKLPEMFRRFHETVNPEKFADEADIRAPGELHFFRAVMKIEFRGECFGKRPCARAARVNKRAVNVEENQPDHARAG
jgi:hypothetical protein